MDDTLTVLEERRLVLQYELDTAKTQAERNRLGQFATPPFLALDMLACAKRLMPQSQKVHFLDPALGTGGFYSALLRVVPAGRIAATAGYEIDAHYGTPALSLWGNTDLRLHLADFTRAIPPAPELRFNLLICNPPYVRHHHLLNGEKTRLQNRVVQACGIRVNGLAGLYCYYIVVTSFFDY